MTRSEVLRFHRDQHALAVEYAKRSGNVPPKVSHVPMAKRWDCLARELRRASLAFCKTVGVDPTKPRIIEGRHCPPGFLYVNAIAEELPFPDDFASCDNPYASIPLPFTGSGRTLRREVWRQVLALS